MVSLPSPMMMGVMGFRWRECAASDVEAEQAEFFFPERVFFPEFLHALGFVLQTSMRDAGRATDGGCDVENKTASPVIEKIDEIARAADVSPESADGFRQCSYLDIDAAVHVEMIDRAAAVATEDAGGVGVVNHHDGAVFFRNVAEAGQRADVAIHGEDAIADQQLPCRDRLLRWLVALRRGLRLYGERPEFSP